MATTIEPAERARRHLDIWLPAVIGIFGLLYLLTVAGSNPSPSPFAYRIYITVLALAAAAFAAAIPGLFNIKLSGPGIALRTAGALAVFVVVLFYEPVTRSLSAALGVSDQRSHVSDRAANNEPEPIGNPYESEFRSTAQVNRSFDEVKALFDQELLRTRASVPRVQADASARQLVDHYIGERQTYLSGYRQELRDAGSATKGSSGGRKTAPLEISCPADMKFVPDSVRTVNKVGGCYGPDDVTETSARAMISQTGKGRSACALIGTCQFTAEYIAQTLAVERAALSNAASR